MVHRKVYSADNTELVQSGSCENSKETNCITPGKYREHIFVKLLLSIFTVTAQIQVTGSTHQSVTFSLNPF